MPDALLTWALVRWQHAAGPFWPYVCAAPFLSTEDAETLAQQAWARACAETPGEQRVRSGRRATVLADRLLSAVTPARPALPHHTVPREPRDDTLGLPLSRAREMMSAKPIFAPRSGAGGEGILPESGGEGPLTVLLVDLPAEPLLAAAPVLVERGWYVVPVVQRWIVSPAVLPCRRLVERLMLGAWRARRPTSPRGAVLIADGERRGPAGYPVTVAGRAFDNRYEYQICRFPSTDFLKAQGVEQVQWIAGGASHAERPVRPDLAPYLEELLRAGLVVEVLPWPS